MKRIVRPTNTKRNVQLDWHWWDRSVAPGRFKNQEANEPWSFQGSRCFPDSGRRGKWPLPWCRVDSRKKRSWVLRRVFERSLHSLRLLMAFAALRWFSGRKTIPLQTWRLQHSKLAAKFRRLDSRRFGLSPRFCPSRCYQNTNTKSKFWESREWLQDCWKYDEERRNKQLLQGFDTETTNDRA